MTVQKGVQNGVQVGSKKGFQKGVLMEGSTFHTDVLHKVYINQTKKILLEENANLMSGTKLAIYFHTIDEKVTTNFYKCSIANK